MKVLLTGATGMIGRQLMDSLTRQGDDVRVIVRPESSGQPQKIQALNRFKRVSVITASLSNLTALERVTRGVEVLYHLAWPTGPESERRDIAAAMVRATDNLLQASVCGGVRRFIFVSSVSVYGESTVRLLRPVKEDAPLLGTGAYAQSKIAAERLVRQCHEEHGLEFVILRPSLVYGRGAPYIEKFIHQVTSYPVLSFYRSKEELLQLIHVRDVTAALVASATRSSKRVNDTFNVAGNEAIYARELIVLVNALRADHHSWQRSSFSLDAATVPLLKYDISRASKKLEFIPRVKLPEGLAEILAARNRAL